MIFASACIWLLVVVLVAWGVDHLWSGIIRTRAVGVLLLPGTMVAYIGRTIGLLLTGADLNAASGKSEDVESEPVYVPRIGFFGPLVVGLIPMVLVAASLYVLLAGFAQGIVKAVPHETISLELPVSLAAFWEQLRGLVTLAEKTLEAIRSSEFTPGRLAIVTYLMICLCVRLAPMPGNAHGHLGAIVATFAVAALAGTLTPAPENFIRAAWPFLAVALGLLLVLLLISLLARALHAVVRMVAHWK